VDEIKKKLVAAGFSELKEVDTWSVKPKDKVYHNLLQAFLVLYGILPSSHCR